jgi:Ser/Thr protein kinase RdoA (MazF antagonist)
VRVGATVRRPTGPWTPTIHALLQHLEAVGFDGAPRVLGMDDHGREILELIPGAMAWPEMGALRTDDGLARAARLLRRYHEAVADFVVPVDAQWQLPDMAPDCEPFVDDEGVIVCHNDCAAWNLVMGDDRWAFIDWDVAGPRPRLWDVAYAIRGMVLIDRPVDVSHRLEVFCNAYGVREDERARLPEIVVARIQSSIDLMRRRGEAGEEPWASMWTSNHRVEWEATREYARSVLFR